MTQGQTDFAALVRRYRRARGWTQDELAEHAGISSRTVSDIERGISRFPHRDTVALLARAFALSERDTELFLAAASEGPEDGHGGSSSSDLPTPSTSLIGRDDEIARCVRTLTQASPRVRLLTLTGPAGVGKTRLAVALAHALASHYPDGIWFIDLVAARAWPDVVRELARHILADRADGQVATQEAADIPLGELLDRQLGQRRCLVILDTMDHLRAAGSELQELMRLHAHLSVLVASQTRLALPEEHVYEVRPLAVPTMRRPAVETLLEYPAIALFVERVQALVPDFVLTPRNAQPVLAICASVNGIPLALEIVAAQAQRMALSDIKRQIADMRAGAILRFRMRGFEGRKRHVTLEDTLDWSYRLLDARVQVLFRRLSVFQGAFALEAAAAVGDLYESIGLDCAEGLAILVNAHLVQVIPPDDPQDEERYSLLDIIRVYGLSLLKKRGELDAIQAAHAQYYRRFVLDMGLRYSSPRQADALAACDRAYDNILAAMRWAREQGRFSLLAELTGPFWWYWEKRRSLTEGREWIEGTLALYREGQDVRAGDMGGLHYGAAILAAAQGAYADALRHGEASLRWLSLGENREKVAQAHMLLGTIALKAGEQSRARRYLTEALATLREHGSPRTLVHVLNNLSALAIEAGDLDDAIEPLEESIAIKRQLGDQRGIAVGLINLSELEKQRGQHARALAAVEEAREIFTTLGDQMGIAMALNNSGEIALAQGEFPHALDALRESLTLFRRSENRVGMAMVSRSLGDTLLALGEDDEAVAAWLVSLEMQTSGPHAPHCLNRLAEQAERRGDLTTASYLRDQASLRANDSAPGAEQDADEMLLAKLHQAFS